MSYNILVVEDTPDWRTKMVGYLIEEGEYDVAEAKDYETARKLLHEELFDVVLLDIRLTDWDECDEQGMQLLRELDSIAELNGTQAIVITGYPTMYRMREAFRDHHVVDFLMKQHFDPQEFKATVLEATHRAYSSRAEILEKRYTR